jgi:methane monooxygenase component D
MSSQIFGAGDEDETSLGAQALTDLESAFSAAADGTEIYSKGRYKAFAQDVECMWRWEIHRDDEIVQVGCSLSESSSREAVAHVISFYQRRDSGQVGNNVPDN